jgi:hypothetical protein
VPRRLSRNAATADVVVFPTPARMKNPAAVALGKLGGSKGGKARAINLSTEEKKAIARQGGIARQAKARLLKLEAEANASRREGSS